MEQGRGLSLPACHWQQGRLGLLSLQCITYRSGNVLVNFVAVTNAQPRHLKEGKAYSGLTLRGCTPSRWADHVVPAVRRTEQ